MAHATHDAKGWRASFRGMHHPKGQRLARLRVPPSRLAGIADHAQQQARAVVFAENCDSACRVLEGPHEARDVLNAQALGVITGDQATALLRGEQAPAARRGHVTIEGAFLAHPSSRKLTLRESRRYLTAITAFATWSKVSTLDALTLSLVQRWRDELEAQGYSFDSRRHHLLPLRRAAQMAGSYGMGDVIGRLTLDAPGRRPVIQTWTLPEVAQAIAATQAAGDLRAAVAIALGGIVGLRPSECIRIRTGDLTPTGRLPIGLLPGREHEAKNNPSRRLLPLPATVAGWMRRLAKGRAPGETLLQAWPGHPWRIDDGNAAAKPFTQETFNQWMARVMEKATGRRFPARNLRKAFATWARRAGLNHDHREQFLGHETEAASDVTAQHYTADLHEQLADEMAPTAAAIDAHLRTALANLKATKKAPPKAPPQHKSRTAKARG